MVASAIRNIFLSVNSPVDLLTSNLHTVFVIYFVLVRIQKQPFADVLKHRCSYKFLKIHIKTYVLGSPTLVKRDFSIGVFLLILRNF